MADAASRVTFFLQAQGSAGVGEGVPAPPTGWTETFYSQQDDLAQILTDAKKYISARAALLGTGASIMYVRAAKIPPTRITKVYFTVGKEGVNVETSGRVEQAYDPSQIDLLVRVEGADGHRRQLWLGGLPDDLTSTFRAQGIQQSFIHNSFWKAYVKSIKDNNFFIRFLKEKGPPKVYDTTSIATLVPIMVRKRNRGRPFYLFRGRRQA